MCNPVLGLAVAGFGVKAASSILEYKGQRQQYISNYGSAVKSYDDEYAALSAQGDQVSRRASEDIVSNEIAALQQRGAAVAQASGRGLAGISLSEVLQGVGAFKNRSNSITELNRKNTLYQIGQEKIGAASTAMNRINSVARPSVAKLGFNIASAALEAGGWYKSMQNAGGK